MYTQQPLTFYFLFIFSTCAAISAQAEPQPESLPQVQTQAQSKTQDQTQAQQAPPGQPLLQKQLEQLYFEDAAHMGTDPIYAIGPLLELYKKNQYRLLWQEKQKIDELHQAVLASAEDGLTPADYHLQFIDSCLKSPEERLSTQELVTRDILLSDAFLLLGEHNRHGKVNIHDAPDKKGLLGTEMPQVDVTFYLSALSENKVLPALSGLTPQTEAYTNLKRGLAHYLAIADKGDWPPIPDGGKGLKLGMSSSRIPLIRERLFLTGELTQGELKNNRYDKDLAAAVQIFQERNGLEPDGVAGKSTIAAMNVPIETRIQQIRANMERIRWILHGMPPSALIVDIAGFRLNYFHNNTLAWTTRVMVGRPLNQTPVFRSAINYLVLNPTWTVPPDMLKKEVIPRIITNRSYLQNENLKVYTFQGEEVNARGIDWASYKDKGFPYVLQQEPGPDNSLGRIKFMFPNPYHVYLHDTPSKSLFSRNTRALSHGCIRVQSPLDLGRMIVDHDANSKMSVKQYDAILAAGKTTGFALKTPLPVFLVYTTARAEEDIVFFNPDVYDRDEAVIKALNRPPRALEQATIPAETLKTEKEQPDNHEENSL